MLQKLQKLLGVPRRFSSNAGEMSHFVQHFQMTTYMGLIAGMGAALVGFNQWLFKEQHNVILAKMELLPSTKDVMDLKKDMLDLKQDMLASKKDMMELHNKVDNVDRELNKKLDELLRDMRLRAEK